MPLTPKIYRKFCEVCYTEFRTERSTAKYCCVRCRKASERDREKTKASMFYVHNKANDDRILCELHRPTLDEVERVATALETIVDVTNSDKAVMIWGIMPEGWVNRPRIFICYVDNPAEGHPHWFMGTQNIVRERPKPALPFVKDGKPLDDAQLAAALLAQEEADAKAQEELEERAARQAHEVRATSEPTTSNPLDTL